MVGGAQSECAEIARDREGVASIGGRIDHCPIPVLDANFHLRRIIEIVLHAEGKRRIGADGQDGLAGVDAQVCNCGGRAVIIDRIGDDFGIHAILGDGLEIDLAVFGDIDSGLVVEFQPFIVAPERHQLADTIPDGLGVLVDLDLDVDGLVDPLALLKGLPIDGGKDVRDRRVRAHDREDESGVSGIGELVNRFLDLQHVTDADGVVLVAFPFHGEASRERLSPLRQNVAATGLVGADGDGAQLRTVEIGEVVDHRHGFGAIAFGQVEIDREGRGIRHRVVLFDALIISVGGARVRIGHIDFDPLIALGGGRDETAQIQGAVQHRTVAVDEKRRGGVDVCVAECRRGRSGILGAFGHGDKTRAGDHVVRRSACIDFQFGGADFGLVAKRSIVAFGGEHGDTVGDATILHAKESAAEDDVVDDRAAAINVDVRIVG